MIGYCVKRPVSAVVTLKDGRVLIGGNFCTNQQPTCPRQPGEGYEKCYTVCGQIGHAEQVAIRLIIAEQLTGPPASTIASVDVYGHHGPCDACKRMLATFGLDKLTKFHPFATPGPIDRDTVDAVDKEYALTRVGSHSKQYGEF